MSRLIKIADWSGTKRGNVVFVHGLGGLVIKSVLRAANEQKADPKIGDFLNQCREVVFIATPHTGAGMATWLEWFAWITWPSGSARNLVANTPELRDLNFGYRIFTEARAAKLHHLVYYEMVDTMFGRVVSPASADPGLPNCKPTPIREDHITIAKPRRRDDLVYAETKNLVQHLASEPKAPGELRPYPLEPFKIEWSWKPLVPKLVRVATLGLLIVGLWQGVPRLNGALRAVVETQKEVAGMKPTLEATKIAVVETQVAVTRMDPKLDKILKAVEEKEGVPLKPLSAILVSMGDTVETLDPTKIEEKLRAKASEFKALSDRLNRLSSDDPEVVRLRKAASEALNKGLFRQADADLAAAEARDLAALEEFEAAAKEKRLSAAQSRAERAAAALLRVNPDAYREAANHYAEAARIAGEADSKIAREYARQQGETLLMLGDEFGLNAALQESIEQFRGMLASVDKADDPNEWTRTQTYLGDALQTLGKREIGTEKLEEAVSAYREALKDWTQASSPFDWAMAQNNLGNVLQALGDRQSDRETLEQAVAAYREALKEWTQASAPLNWANTQNNLGNAFQRLGQLDQAVAAYHEALKEFTRERMPIKWANSQNGLAAALLRLGERESGTEKLEEAVAAYREALKEWTRERVPLKWGGMQYSLGTALWTLGERESGTEKLEEAVAAYREALKERTRERVPLDWANTQYNLGLALSTLGARGGGTEKLEEALAAYRDSLAVAKIELAKQPTNSLCQETLRSSIEAIGVLAYRFVFAHDFAKALEVADEAIALAPDKIWIYTNRAHALMFLGRLDEARALYHQYRGIKSLPDEKSWETDILDDFAELRKAGLTNPLMDEIETQFAAGG